MALNITLEMHKSTFEMIVFFKIMDKSVNLL